MHNKFFQECLVLFDAIALEFKKKSLENPFRLMLFNFEYLYNHESSEYGSIRLWIVLPINEKRTV